MGLKIEKAKSEKAYVKGGLYGESGTGKTLTALLLAEFLAAQDPQKRRMLYIDTEGGTDYYAQDIEARKVHPKAFDFDIARTREVLAVRDLLADPETSKKWCAVVLDSMTHFWESAKESYTGNMTSAGTYPIQAWAKIKPPYKAILSNGMNGLFHFLICGRERIVFEDDGDGKMKAQGTTMKAEGETPYEPDLLLHMYQERESKDAKGLTPFIIRAYVEKDRSGVLMGRTLTFPRGEDFEPLVKLLGTNHGQLQTIEEAAAADAERQADDERRKQAERDSTFNMIRRSMESAVDPKKTVEEQHDALKAAWALTKGKKRILGDEKYDDLETIKDNLKQEINNVVSA